MKRIFAAVLALCLCVAGAAMAEEGAGEWAAGDTVVFGSYEQDNGRFILVCRKIREGESREDVLEKVKETRIHR